MNGNCESCFSQYNCKTCEIFDHSMCTSCQEGRNLEDFT